MKTNKKQLLTALVMGVVMVILFVGGCKKELANDSTELKVPDIQMSNDGASGMKKVLRQSPGLKIEVKSKTISRVFPKLQGAEKMTSILKEESKKKKPEAITISNATFTATDLTTYYSCETDFPQISGDKDFYLVNINTWVYTYVGSSSTSYLTFNVNRPSMYGNYRVWTEGINGSGFSNNLYLGDPYSGVSISSGILEFTDAAAFVALNDRLEQAYEDHSAAFYDGLSSSWTDEQVNDYADSQGFDDLLPLKEFENYWGLYSLRQRIESEITDENPFPEAAYEVADEVQGALINQYGQYKIASTTITELYMGGATPDQVGNCYRTFNVESPDTYPVSSDPGHFVKARIWSRGVEQHPIALIKSRHTKPNGGSKRYATKLNARMSGNAFQNNCINYDAFNSGWKGEKTRKRMRVKAWDTGIPAYFDWLYFHTGHATGSFTVRGNAISVAY